MSDIYLNWFPKEVLDQILPYLSAHHILRSFYSINDYLDRILISYDQYFLDLSSSDISKNEFDLICSFLQPEQIVGLKIGKADFDLFDRFLSSISTEEHLTRLRSLWIDDTTLVDELLISKFSRIVHYNELIAIRFDRICFNTNSSLMIKYSFDCLSHLVTTSSSEFLKLCQSIPTHLTYLHMFFDSRDDMVTFIHHNVYQLKSLGVGIQCKSIDLAQVMWFFENYQFPQLIQLNLNLNGNLENRYTVYFVYQS